MTIELPPLPYAEDALEPHISAKTMSFHYGKHHKTYVDKLNGLIADTDFENDSLEEIVKKSSADTSKAAIFNNAAQVWNHTFFWNCLKPNGGGQPSGDLLTKIDSDLGGIDKFREDFKNAAIGQFGSGWAWLVLVDGKLEIKKTANADLPMVHGKTALFTCDVWEHAYYLDYQNKRPDFVQAVLDNLVNWEFVEQNFKQAMAKAA